jgi:hypothetical protein
MGKGNRTSSCTHTILAFRTSPPNRTITKTVCKQQGNGYSDFCFQTAQTNGWRSYVLALVFRSRFIPSHYEMIGIICFRQPGMASSVATWRKRCFLLKATLSRHYEGLLLLQRLLG